MLAHQMANMPHGMLTQAHCAAKHYVGKDCGRVETKFECWLFPAWREGR